MDWDPAIEEDLASGLVTVDDMMNPSREELNLESQLRKPTNVPGMEVEMSLKRRAATKDERERNEAEEAKAAAKEVAEKKNRKADLKAEDKRMKETIVAYAKSSQTKAEHKALTAARNAVEKATDQVTKLKDTDHYRDFKKEYYQSTPVGNEAGNGAVPAGRLGESHDNDHDTTLQDDPNDTETADLSASKVVDTKLSHEALKELADLKKSLGDAGVTSK